MPHFMEIAVAWFHKNVDFVSEIVKLFLRLSTLFDKGMKMSNIKEFKINMKILNIFKNENDNVSQMF